MKYPAVLAYRTVFSYRRLTTHTLDSGFAIYGCMFVFIFVFARPNRLAIMSMMKIKHTLIEGESRGYEYAILCKLVGYLCDTKKLPNRQDLY